MLELLKKRYLNHHPRLSLHLILVLTQAVARTVNHRQKQLINLIFYSVCVAHEPVKQIRR